jgi:hypothetical protein
MKVYHEKRKQFYEENPELAHKRADGHKKERVTRNKKSDDEKLPKAPKKKKECAYITPCMVFQDSLRQEGRSINHFDSQAMYKALSDDEKLKYILKLINMDTNREKQFSKTEQKIVKFSSGVPKKPLSAYNSFVHDLSKSLGKPKDILKIASAQWKNIDPEKKRPYDEKFQNELAKWQEKALTWIDSLPKEQQAEQLAKHGLLQKVDRSGAKRRRQSTGVIAEPSEPPTKKDKQEKTLLKGNKKVIEAASLSPAASPRKESKKEESIKIPETSSPKKSKFKDFLAKVGPYPSLTTAHYFMSKKYSGKPHKVAKGYGKLSHAEKKQLLAEVNKIKMAYLKKLRDFAESDKKYVEKIKEMHEKNKKEQNESIGWYSSTNTDQESDSESDSD